MLCLCCEKDECFRGKLTSRWICESMQDQDADTEASTEQRVQTISAATRGKDKRGIQVVSN